MAGVPAISLPHGRILYDAWEAEDSQPPPHNIFMILNSLLYLAFDSTAVAFTTALALVVAFDSHSLKIVSFVPPSVSSQATLSVLNEITVTSKGSLISSPTSPVEIVHGATRYRIGGERDNITFSLLVEESQPGCLLNTYDGRRILLSSNQTKSVVGSLSNSTPRPDIIDSQRPISDVMERNFVCPRHMLEHDSGMGIMSSGFVWNFSRINERWELNHKIDAREVAYFDQASALIHGQFLYILDPAAGLLTRYFLSDPVVKAQELRLTASGSLTSDGLLLLSPGGSNSPTSIVYAAFDDSLFVIALPDDPLDGLSMVKSIKTSLSDIKSGVLFGPENAYLGLSGAGGIRVLQRGEDGTSIAQIAVLEIEKADGLICL
ncbi:hypothetical protein RhiLY_05170 [Ceratobasidium sp. AG-Ba]|nr:hypothetical protein RhiLY_05170 [Ceratobasidium sp. AG-Ba]